MGQAVAFQIKSFTFAGKHIYQDIRMKKVFKLAGGFMVGACIGFVGIIGVRVLVLGDSFDGLHSKFAETGMLETVGVSLLAILILLFSIFLQVLLHEGGHLVCGLATGYRFVSFRIFNLTFIRKDGKLCIKRFSLAGTGGQCLLTPPERPLEDIPTTLYNLGGVLANLLTAILAFLPLLTVDGLPYLLKFFLLMLSLIGILLAGMNGIPMKMGGIGNDADNMRLLLKDSKSKQALVTQLRINALVQEGMRPKDMPAEWFSQTEDINYKDALQVTIALMSASRLLDCEEWEAAYNAFEKIMSHRHEVIGLLIKENACELLFTALVTKRTARAEELYTDELDTYIRQYKDVTSSKQRLLCAPGQGHSKSKGDLRSHLPTEKQILDAGRSQFGHSLDEINPYRQECLVRWNDISFTCYICCLAAHYAVVAENKRQSRHKTQIRRPPSRTPTP